MTDLEPAVIPIAVKERADGDTFISVPFLKLAAIGDTDVERLFFCREAVTALLDLADRVVKESVIGLIDGLPGTGKSSTLWYKMLCLAANQGKRVAWFHFDRNGLIEARVLLDAEGGHEMDLVMEEELPQTLLSTDAEVLVLDGVTQSNFKTSLEKLRFWRKKGTNRSGFLTMSNKVERLHPHEIRAMKEPGLYNYYTQHSWTLDELLTAFMKADGSKTPLFAENVEIFEREWEIEQENHRETRKRDRRGLRKIASVEEIITQKYFFTGGSARWMLQLTRAETEREIRSSVSEASKVGDILDFNIGPKSSSAKTHLYSSREKDGYTQYAIVSERATQILVETYGVNGIRTLYSHASKINNPAFLGWVVEADYFSRCETDTLQLRKRGDLASRQIPCYKPLREFDCAELKLLSGCEDKTDLYEAVRSLLPSDQTNTTICKPTSWNQGGYDVIRIEKDTSASSSQLAYHFIFGQVTKSKTHSLKLQYFSEFCGYITAAGYTVSSVEIGFIVPSGRATNFRITSSQVTGKGLLSHCDVHGASPPTAKWKHSHEHELITVYELDMLTMNFPNNM